MNLQEKRIATYTATIYCGLKEGFDGRVHDIEEARSICQDFCSAREGAWVGLTLKSVEVIYPGGTEPGVEVGLINYPRFPVEPSVVQQRAIELAARLMGAFCQLRVSVVCSDMTIMLERSTHYEASSGASYQTVFPAPSLAAIDNECRDEGG